MGNQTGSSVAAPAAATLVVLWIGAMERVGAAASTSRRRRFPLRSFKSDFIDSSQV